VKYEKDAGHRKVIQSLAGKGRREVHVPTKLTVRLFTVPKSSPVMSLGIYPRFSKMVRRQWPPVNKCEQNEPADQGQMEFAFMVDCDNGPKIELGEFTNDISKFNVPPKRTVPDYPALPPNPMRAEIR
jgi:hypothetical protein